MSKRKYSVDDLFFDVIDTQDKAYILGLLYADGCNYEDTGIVKIDLIERDLELLLKISNLLRYEGELKKHTGGIKYFNGIGYECQDSVRLSFRSKQISRQLALKGCTSNKTYSLSFPSNDIIPDNLIRHFIRGYMDGDGGISYWIDNQNTGHKKFQINFCGTVDVIKGIGNTIDNQIGCTTSYTDRYPDRDNNNLQSGICGNQMVKKVLDWLYEDANTYMDRKYQKYLELIDEIDRVKNDDKLYGNAYTRRAVIRLSDLHVYKTLNGAAKENNVCGSTMYKYCRKNNGFMYYDEYEKIS